MQDNQLEHPTISTIIRTGYPYSNRRHTGEPEIVKIVELGDEDYIKILEDRKPNNEREEI